MPKHARLLLAVLIWTFFLLAIVVATSLLHGIWTERLFNPGAKNVAPHAMDTSPGLYWMAFSCRVVLAIFFASLGALLLRVRRKRFPPLA